MSEKYDLIKMLEEIKEDEKLGQKQKTVEVSQKEIEKMLKGKAIQRE